MQEVLLEADLGGMHPFARTRPVHVPGRDLRLGHEGHAAITKVGKADRIPSRNRRGLPAGDQAGDVLCGGGDHRLDHEAGLWHPYRYRGLTHWRNGDADTDREHVLERRVALILVRQDKAPRIGQALNAAHRRYAAERGQHHGLDEGDFVSLPHRAIVGDFADERLSVVELVHLGIGDEADVTLPHLAFEQALSIADTIEAKVADTHPKVQELREAMLWSEGQVWTSPERHGAMSAVLKSQIDWIPLPGGAIRPTQGRTLALMQVSGGRSRSTP